MNVICIRTRGWPDGDNVLSKKEHDRNKLLNSIPVQIPIKEKRENEQHLPTGKHGACNICLQWLPLTKHHVKPMKLTGTRNSRVEKVCVKCYTLIHRTFTLEHLMTTKWSDVRAAIIRLRDL